MIELLLTIIIIFLYLIYKGQKPKIKSGEKVKENIQMEINRKEEFILREINASRLKDYMQDENTFLDCGKKNFIRLNERFQHDEIKLEQIIKDWLSYLETLSDIIFESEMLDVSTSEDEDAHWNNRYKLIIKIQEIEKRFKLLLGDDYIDPFKIISKNQS